MEKEETGSRDRRSRTSKASWDSLRWQEALTLTFVEGRLLGLQPDLHNVQRRDCKQHKAAHASRPVGGGLQSGWQTEVTGVLGLTKDGCEKGSGAGGQHLLRGRDGHHGAPGSPLPHPALLSEHTTHRLNPGSAQSFQTFPHLSCFQAFLLTTHTLSF